MSEPLEAGIQAQMAVLTHALMATIKAHPNRASLHYHLELQMAAVTEELRNRSFPQGAVDAGGFLAQALLRASE